MRMSYSRLSFSTCNTATQHHGQTKSWARGMFKLMTRFWPTLGITCLFAGILAFVGSRARTGIIDPQGLWLGPWPLPGADECRTKLLPNGRFEMECRGRDKYVGAGTWRRNDDQVHFAFRFLAKGESRLDVAVKTYRIRTKGRQICLGEVDGRGEPFCWSRAAP